MEPFTLSFDVSSKVPLYRQLYQFLSHEIRKGNLRCGEKLPSKRQLCSFLKISQNTVETAYEMLLTEGYIRSVPKSGFYVCELSQPIPTISHPPISLPIKKTTNESFLYDFRTKAVDTSLFPYSTWAKISRETVYQNPQLLNPGEAQGDLYLRVSLAKYLHESRGVNCLPEQIIIGAGIEYLIGLTAQLFKPQDKFAVENPGYSGTAQILQNNGRNVLFLPIGKDGITLNALEKNDPQVVYLTPSHQFPMGIIMPIGHRNRILNWAYQKQERYLIEDDYDSEFRFNVRPIPCLQGLDTHSRVIYIGTFSRSIAPSIRIAYLVLPPALLERYWEKFGRYSSTVSRFEQYTLARFLSEGHFSRHINRMRNLYRQRKETLVTSLKESGIPLNIMGEDAGLHLLTQIKNGMSENELIHSAKSVGIHLTGLSQYCMESVPIPTSTLIWGYAGLTAQEIREAILLLRKIWSNR